MLKTDLTLQIAQAIDAMHDDYIDRFRIRRSFNDAERYGSGQVGEIENSFQCPHQLGKVSGCGDCMICTYSRKNVRFIDHGRPWKNEQDTTMHKWRIVEDFESVNILRPGEDNDKLTGYVTRGKWMGARILNVSGIERHHCPASCHFRNKCYGNGYFGYRFNIDRPEVQEKLYNECMELPKLGRGYAIRLHVVGDFPNVEYVDMWRTILQDRKDIKCFGFTANPINVNRELW